VSNKETTESLEAAIRDASLKCIKAETEMESTFRELRDSDIDVEELTEKLNEYGERLRGLGVAEKTIRGLVQKPEICGEKTISGIYYKTI
jgi:hypothetical protein